MDQVKTPSQGLSPNIRIDEREELPVSLVLLLVLVIYTLSAFTVYKCMAEARRQFVLPVLTFICFNSMDWVYRHWADLPSNYGNKPYELAFLRTALVVVIGRLLALREQDTFQKKTTEDAAVDRIALWFIWFPIIGALWAVQELLLTYPENFICLAITYAVLVARTRSIGSKSTALIVSISISATIMAKSGQLHWRPVLAGFVRVAKILAIDFAVTKHGPVSSFNMIWKSGVFASGLTLLAFITMELFNHSSRHDFAADTVISRGFLDYVSTACVAALLYFAAFVGILEIMNTASMLSLQSASVLVELLVLCVLTPLSNLPLGYVREIPLNVTGFILGTIVSLVQLRTDPFASTSLASSALFKFLDEEAERAAQGMGNVKEIGEDEWLLDLKAKGKKGDDV